MKRAIPASVLCVTMALCCVGCGINISFKGGSAGTSTAGATGDETGKLVLTVFDSSWDGWTMSVSEGKSQTYDVELNEHCVFSEGVKTHDADGNDTGSIFDFSFTITEVNDDGITIETDQALCKKSAKGTINLMNPQHEFHVTMDKPCKLATPTMDGGKNYELTLSRT